MSTTYRMPGAVLTEREHSVPLVHGDPSRGTISVFTRELAAPDGLDRPYLVFLQGGPGFEAARPTSPPSGWMARALADFRVLLLDQRGTGRSTPVGPVIPGAAPADQAEYLTHFRADSIVRDLELIRAELGVDRWSLLGQSFGGFTSLTYLSLAPEGLREVLITGGLAPIDEPAGRRGLRGDMGARARSESALPRRDTRETSIVCGRSCAGSTRRTSACPTATASHRVGFGRSACGSATAPGSNGCTTCSSCPSARPAFLVDAQMASPWERNPIYATLHESSYADGGATRWSAHRLAPEEAMTGDLLGAEHVFPWMWDDYAGLRAHREAAQLLAQHPWPRLYDADRLARNEVPVAATVYVDDVYVERSFAEETARGVRGLRAWVTNEYAHNGLRADGERIVGRLLDMVRGRA